MTISNTRRIDGPFCCTVCDGCIHKDKLPSQLPCRECRVINAAAKARHFVPVSDLRRQYEADPTGRSAHEAGAKLDRGKNRLSLVLGGFSHALQAVGEVGTYGANKYTDDGWRSVPDGRRRYADAMLRHLFAELGGQERDPDTELLHAAHTAWNALARLELVLLSSASRDETFVPAVSGGTIKEAERKDD